MNKLFWKFAGFILFKLEPVKKIVNKIIDFIVMYVIAKIKWRQKHELTDEEKQYIAELLKKDYYIIATRRNNYLSSFFIYLSHFLLTFKWGYYTHVLMNLEDEVKSYDDFRLIEATSLGTTYSSFDRVMSEVDALVLLKPKNITIEEWTAAMDASKFYLGRPYDSLFDLKDASRLSCVELVRAAMQSIPDYHIKFSKFESMIASKKNLTPQMFIDCGDFVKVYEIKKT